MISNKYVRITLLVALLLAGTWFIARQVGLGVESATRAQAVRQSMAPAGVQLSDANAEPYNYEAIQAYTVNLSDIPANVPNPDSQYDRWLRGEIDLDEQEYRVPVAVANQLKADAMALAADEDIQIAPTGPQANAPTPGVAFDSLDASECCGGGLNVPPDPEMAAGPDHLIAVVNVALEIYDKNGNSVAGPTTLASFFNSNPSCNGEFDPTVKYDEEAGRWVLGADANGTHFCVAVSQTDDPTGSWNIYAVPAQPVGGEFHDYPHTGVGDSYIVVGANQFGGAIPGGFEGRVWALDKAVMYSGGALAPVTFSTGGTEGTPQPMHLSGFGQGTWPSYGNTHYFVTDPYDGCTLNIWEWDIPNAPAIVETIDQCAETGVTGGFPVDWSQQGGGLMQANDWRMRNLFYRNGSAWVTDSVSCNPGAGTVNCVRWMEIDMTGPTLDVVQAGVYASNGEHRVFARLAVNACNDMAIGYTKGSTSMFPSVYYTGRESGDPLGTLQAEALLKAGEINYTAFDGQPRRWGDYTGMAIDPDGVTFWYLGEYSKNIGVNAKWGNYIGSFSYPGCGLEPIIDVDPMALDSTQAPNATEVYTLSISNIGSGTLDWMIVEEAASAAAAAPAAPVAAAEPVVSSPADCAAFENYAGREPEGYAEHCVAELPEPSVGNPMDPTDTAYALDIGFVSDNFVSHVLNDFPGQTVVGANARPIFAMDFDQSATTLYAIDNTSRELGTLDLGTGAFTPIAVVSGIPVADNISGLTIDPNTGTAYVSGLGAGMTLYTMDLGTAVATPIGTDPARGLMIDIAMGPQGVMYGHDISDDVIYTVDTSTGLATPVGPTGVNSNFAQGMDFDNIDGTLYAYTYQGGGANVYGTIDLTTGTLTPLATSNPQGEFEGATQTAGGPTCDMPADIPWLSVSPTSGSTTAGATDMVDVTFDSTGLSTGTYTGTLCIESNDTSNPVVRVPVSMTVSEPSYGVDLEADAADSADPGDTVTYMLTLENTGNVEDTFTLAVSGNAWTTTLSDTSVTLAAGASTTVEVDVEIPAGADPGDMDEALVTATSDGDPTATDAVTLTTSVTNYPTFLPLMLKQP